MFDYMANTPRSGLSIWLTGIFSWPRFTSDRGDGEPGRVDNIRGGSVVVVRECVEVNRRVRINVWTTPGVRNGTSNCSVQLSGDIVNEQHVLVRTGHKVCIMIGYICVLTDG